MITLCAVISGQACMEGSSNSRKGLMIRLDAFTVMGYNESPLQTSQPNHSF
jgi:hypothetical protein